MDAHRTTAVVGNLFAYVSLLIALGATLVACASSAPETQNQPRECPTAEPLGDRASFTLAGTTIEGVSVREVETCGDPKVGYIRLDPADGTRVLTLGRNEEGGVDDCTPNAENPTTCPRVNVDKFLGSVHAELESRGIEAIGIGLGACGDHTGGYDAWNVSVAIRNWKDANEAVEVMAQKMKEWDVQTHSGISVRGIPCATLLERPEKLE